MYPDEAEDDRGVQWDQQLRQQEQYLLNRHKHRNTTMPKLSDMMESKYLKQDDVGEGVKVTISGVKRANVARDDAPPEHKWILVVEEFEKGLVLNTTNMQLLASICKSEDTDDWLGQKVVLYTDPHVQYQGKLVGGIRVRSVVKRQRVVDDEDDSPAPAPKAKTSAGGELPDDVPFN